MGVTFVCDFCHKPIEDMEIAIYRLEEHRERTPIYGKFGVGSYDICEHCLDKLKETIIKERNYCKEKIDDSDVITAMKKISKYCNDKGCCHCMFFDTDSEYPQHGNRCTLKEIPGSWNISTVESRCKDD